ncbi:hypothetical protein SteCoe_9429 [Stentor coeruleus]|uniref:Major facilitator superfamily (MFS) profile domain-containing protein n=1 Tax=Stentor coeruleus TaxID=5963 RepID=A0A1R2CHQ4_9CILI|nr:hypothetical protein SteCoe_9429 [Stentor coeruleus]
MDHICLCLYALYFWGCSVYAVLAPFYPAKAEAKGMSKQSIGYLFSLYALVAFMFSPVSGKVMNKIGRRNVLMIGGVLESIGMFIFAFVIDLEGNAFIVFSVIARILMGAGGSALLVTCFAVISNQYPNDMEEKIGLMETLGGVGLMSGPALGGLLYEFTGYKFVFIFYTVLFLALTTYTFKILPEDRPDKEKSESSIKYTEIFSIGKIVLTLIVVIFGMAGPGFLEPVLETNLENSLGLSTLWVGIFFALPTLGYTVAMKLLTMIPKEVDRRHVLFAGLFIEGLSFILLGPFSFFGSPNIILKAISLTTLGFGSAWAYIPSLPLLIETASERMPGIDKEILSNTLSTLMGTTHYLGETLGPIVGGVSVHHFGDQDGYALFGVLILTYFLIYGIINKQFQALINRDCLVHEDQRNIIAMDSQTPSNSNKYDVIEFAESAQHN